jgi:hypothetical protein
MKIMMSHPQVVKNRISVAKIAKELDVENPSEDQLRARKLFDAAPASFRQEVEDMVNEIMVKNYISPREWGKLVKVAFDRAIKFYQRDRIRARELVNFRRTDSDFYQWMEGSGFTAAFNAPGAAKRTVTFDLSSRFARVYKAGLAVEFTDEVRDSMSIDLMAQVISKVVDAFDELETSVVLSGLSAAVADGVKFFGVKHASHILNFNSADYQNNRMDHEKMVDLMYLGSNEGVPMDTATMSLSMFYQLMKFKEFTNAAGDWNYVNSPKAMRVIEGGSMNKPLLPTLDSITRFVVSPLFTEGEVVMYNRDDFMDFAERAPLSSEQAEHDGLHDVSLTTYRTRYGIAAKDPNTGVKGTNGKGIFLPASKFA